MPELPEVNTFQQYFDQTSLHQKIQKVDVKDEKIIRNCTGKQFARKLKGRTFVNSYRRGKYLFGELDNAHHVQFHFAMTGDFVYYDQSLDSPKHERFAFLFDTNFRLGFDCPRKFARIVYIENLQEYIQTKQLGEDALVIKQKAFLSLMENRKTRIKGFLLNQKMLAGVGNLYADEICYQTQIHPASRIDQLSIEQRKAIYKTMQAILKKAVRHEAHYKAYPDDWFWKWRIEGADGPEGSVVKKMTVAGRTTLFCEGWQVLYI